MNNIRNFCIIAHIDHGKSTLADRLLEMTGTIEKRKMKEQVLDTMDLEMERGITIKLQPATMRYLFRNPKPKTLNPEQILNSKFQSSNKFQNLDIENSCEYMLNLIDTPGHVDFSYEVSRSLAAVEGAVLLVDATKGVQAQTLANLYQAIEQNLAIIPVVNKIDLPNANAEKTKKEIISVLGCREEEIIFASGKTGEGVSRILEAIVEKVPAPQGNPDAPLRALIFDSKFDSYKGVLAYVRIFDGKVSKNDELFLMVNKIKAEALETGKFKPQLEPCDTLETGQIGYIATGLKSVEECKVGDTITVQSENFKVKRGGEKNDKKDLKPLPGYKEVRPMVYASFYPQEGEDYNQMRDALDKLKLNDAALTFEGESSLALGRGFRLGFLGLLHLEIIQERLKREFGFQPVITTPSVVYEIKTKSHPTHHSQRSKIKIYSAAELPDPAVIESISEPRVNLEIITPAEYLGEIMKLVNETTRSRYLSTDYIDQDRINLKFDAPLSEIIVNFHDALKSVSKGFASMNYELSSYQEADLIRLDIYLAEDRIDAFAQIVPREKAYSEGRKIVKKLKEAIPRQNFMIKIQAAIGGKVVARESISAFRKDVTGYLYGGDVTRKRKLLEKQKKGKKRMVASGKAHIPQEAFLKVLKNN